MTNPKSTSNKVIDLRDHRPAESLIDIAAVASRLGVSVRHVRRLVDERRIPFIKWGHLLRFEPIEIETWIEECRRRPVRHS